MNRTRIRIALGALVTVLLIYGVFRLLKTDDSTSPSVPASAPASAPAQESIQPPVPPAPPVPEKKPEQQRPKPVTPESTDLNPVSPESLVRDLCSDREITEREAVRNLRYRSKTHCAKDVPALLLRFATGNVQEQRRVWAALKEMGEPARLQIDEITADPYKWEARIVAAAREIQDRGYNRLLSKDKNPPEQQLTQAPQEKTNPERPIGAPPQQREYAGRPIGAPPQQREYAGRPTTPSRP